MGNSNVESAETPQSKCGVFISYAWAPKEEADAIRELANRLRDEGGIHVRIDVDARPGDSLPRFMEESILGSRHILVCCTPEYKNRDEGGLAYEKELLRGLLLQYGVKKLRLVPALVRGDWKEAGPPWLAGRKYLDLRTGILENYSSVLAALQERASSGIASWSEVFEQESMRPFDQVFAIEVLKRPVLLERSEGRVKVSIDRSQTEQGIRTTAGKRELCAKMLAGDGGKIAQDLDDLVHRFLLGRSEKDLLRIGLDATPLRWASGGVLSVVKWRDDIWTPFFFRDIDPIGWNISLGASENESELDNPPEFIYREFLEETLVLPKAPPMRGHEKIKGFAMGDFKVPPHELAEKFARDHIDLRGYCDGLQLGEWGEKVAGHWTTIREHETLVSLSLLRDGNQLGPFKNILMCFNFMELGIEVIKVIEYTLENEDYILDGEIFVPTGELVRMPVGMIKHSYLRDVFGPDAEIQWERCVTEELSAGRWVERESGQPSVLAPRPPRSDEIQVFPWDVEARGTLAEGKRILAGGREPSKTERSRHGSWIHNFGERWFEMDSELTVKSACPFFTATSAKVLQYYFAQAAFRQPGS